MISYEIHSSNVILKPKEQSNIGYENFHEVLIPDKVLTFRDIVHTSIDGINKFLEGQNRNNIELKTLLAKIIPILYKIDKDMGESDQLKSMINKYIIEEFKKMQNFPVINNIEIMKILPHFKVKNINLVKFIDRHVHMNEEILSGIGHDMDLVPLTYNCAVLMSIMTYPIKDTKNKHVEYDIWHINRLTKKPWPSNISIDQDLSNEINHYVQKIEYLYYAYQNDEQKQSIYDDTRVKSLIKERGLSFKHLEYLLQKKLNKEIIKDRPISPCKYILDLFAQNMIQVLRPTKHDYEKLVRSLGASGNYIGLGILLLSPILDFFTINIYARNEKGENALEWIKIHANRYLPYFNTRNALQLTLTAATLVSAATLYLNSSNSDNDNTSRHTMSI